MISYARKNGTTVPYRSTVSLICTEPHILNLKRREKMKSRVQKKFSDLVVKKSIELFGFTPKEKSDQNLKWMLENGYKLKKKSRSRIF